MPEYTKKFEDFTNTILIIVDVQEPFSKYFPDNYIEKLSNLSSKMDKVYQIWDSNDGSVKDYEFPNETESLEKQFGAKPDINLIEPEYQKQFTEDSNNNNFFNEEGATNGYPMTDGRVLIYVGMGGQGPGHEWFFIPSKVKDLFKDLQYTSDMIYLVGGANQECLYDIEIALQYYGINFKKLDDYVYSAN